MGGSLSKNLFKNTKEIDLMKLIKNTDNSTNLDNKVEEGIELRIVECANILVKMDDQFNKKGNQLLRISMVLEQDFVPYQEECDYQSEKIIIGIEWNPEMSKVHKLKTTCIDFEEMSGGRAYINEGCLACSRTNYLQLTNQKCVLFTSTKDYRDANPNPKKELKNKFDFLELDSDEEEDENHLVGPGYDGGSVQRRPLQLSSASELRNQPQNVQNPVAQRAGRIIEENRNVNQREAEMEDDIDESELDNMLMGNI